MLVGNKGTNLVKNTDQLVGNSYDKRLLFSFKEISNKWLPELIKDDKSDEFNKLGRLLKFISLRPRTHDDSSICQNFSLNSNAVDWKL